MPHLTVNASKTELYEGEKMTVTVTNERVPQENLVLSINCDYPDRIKIPETVTMTAGSTTVTFEVEVLQDAIINDAQTATITVAADSHYSGECRISLLDDDIPPTVNTNKAAYKPGETVLINGQMYGLATINAKIAVYIVHNGKRERIETKTDNNGAFTVAYNIPSSQSGHFSIEACLAIEQGSEELASFDTFGLQLGAYYSELYLELGVPHTETIIVSNTVPLKQTELKIEQLGDSTNCKFTFTVPETIEANGNLEITCSITAKALTAGTEWQQMPIEITTNEGAKVSYTFYYYVQSASATLQAEPSTIETTMTKGSTREFPLVITNIGKGETGIMTMDMPDFIKTTTPREMKSLAEGESVTVMLELTPTDNMTVNVPVTGNLAVNCTNGNGLSVNFSLEPVSESTGTLTVDVTDELTYYAKTVKAPHVKDAKVVIKHPATNEVVASGQSNDEGLFTAELAEGLYILEVTAAKHETYRSQIMIDPGKSKHVEAFLTYQNVTYDWTVLETEVEDSYDLELVADYDVRIPKPILDVKIDIDEQPSEGTIIPVVVTNKGLINLNNVDVTLAVIPDDYSIEFQSNPHLDFLAPRQSETFFAKVIYNGPAEARRADGSKGGSGVKGASGNGEGKYLCGNNDEKVSGSDMRFWELTLDEVEKIEEKIEELLKKTPVEDGGRGKPVTKNDTTAKKSTWDYDFPINVGETDVCFDPTNPDDPNNPNAPNDPIDRPNMDGKEPKPDDCDSGEKPKISFCLVPVTGTKYQVEGVAADGVSQVKIILDPTSKVPSDDCENISGIQWSLSRDLGKIEGSTLRNAVYTAPESFPFDFGSSATVKAYVTYIYNSDGIIYDCKDSVTIEIIRPPVVFVHGLGSSQDCWKQLDDMLVDPEKAGTSLNSALYKPNINFRVDYRPNNSKAFQVNLPVVSLGILKAQRRALCQGYVAKKCDLVGHSMGGILSRLYLERGGKEEKANVYRVITVNTPHSGSELGDMVRTHLEARKIAEILYHNDDLGAVEDLAVESDETALLVNTPGNIDIPAYAIGTESDFRDDVLIFGSQVAMAANAYFFAQDVAFVTSGLAAATDPEPITKAILVVLTAAIKQLRDKIAGYEAGVFQHLIEDDYSQIGQGDLVVSENSQIGGCKASEIIKHGPWHVSSTNNAKVKEKVKDLLASNPNDGTFSTEWFKPEKRVFKHDDGWKEGINNVLGFIPVVGSGINLLKGIKFQTGIRLRQVFHSRASSENENNTDNVERVLSVDFETPGELTTLFVSVSLNNHIVYLLEEGQTEYILPPTFAGEVKLIAFMMADDGNIYYDEQILNVEEPLAIPVSLALEETTLIVDDNEPLRLYCTWNDGTETKVVPDSITFEHDNVAALVGKYIVGLKQGRTKVTASYRGLTCEGLIRVFAPADEEDDEEPSESVCSKVTLSFKQQMVTTRQAFRGTLTVNNGSGTKQLKDLKLNLQVKDEMGNIATEHEFQIDPEALDGFEGELDFTSGWSLNAESKGTATILFIPTKYAAQTEPKKWWFGGTFSYTDPDTGLTVTRELYAVQLTVNPTAELDLDYFLQRDVFGDDPLTEDVVEESQPAEFALLINNKGYGDAKNVNLVTNKPEIIDNEKGLLIDFDLLSSQLNGGEKDLSFSKMIPTNFGTIAAHSQTYAQWWLQSSLLGHFVNYNVNATHVTSRDNPDLSLLDQVKVHELIHGFTVNADGEKPLRGFLVNDMPDSQDNPDAVFFTDATNQPVYIATDADITNQSDNEYVLSVNASTLGWNYGSLTDPTNGLQKIGKVTRADGTEICLDNIWQTDRTLRDGKDPLYENRLHFVVNATATDETYHLVFEPKDDVSTGLLQIPNDLHVRISPLPMREHITVTGNCREISNISIYDMRGVKVFNTGNIPTGQDIYLGSLKAGVYFIQVTTDRGVYRVKALKR